MLKYLLSLFSILVLLLPTLSIPAHACPVKLPETLLSLYANSDAIFVARFDKVEDQETIENSDERSIVRIVKHFDVSSALKGETQKLFTIEERDYRYKRDPSDTDDESVSEEPEEEDDVVPYGNRDLKAGDQVLLFLKKDEDGKTLELTDYRDGIKKMTPARLDSYQARINELNSIFSRKTIDNEEVVAWLVRCVLDPHTRWEGAYQLQRSFEQLEWLEEQEKESEENEAPEEETAGGGEAEMADSTSAEGDDAGTKIETTFKLVQPKPWDIAEYARLLTDAQKDELMKVLVDRPATTDDGKEVRLTSGDRILIDVVSNWGDQRFAKFLLDRMQGSFSEPYETSRMMSTIAKVLSDDELSKIADRYSDVTYGDDDEPVEAEELEETDDDEETAAEGDEIESESSDAGGKAESQSESPDASAKTESESKGEVEPIKVTYKEFRSTLLSKFLNRSFVAVSLAEAKNEESSQQSP